MLALSTVPFCSATSTLAPIFPSESAASDRIDNFRLRASARGSLKRAGSKSVTLTSPSMSARATR